jgi:hypothetical protein
MEEILRVALLFMENRRSRLLSARDVMFAVTALGPEERAADGRAAVMAFVGTDDAVFPRELHERLRKLLRQRKTRIKKTAVVFLEAVLN